jgi:hypothetical protein
MQSFGEGREVRMSKLYGPAQLLMAVLVMCLAVYAVPFPGSLVLLGTVAPGAVWAFFRLRRRERQP